jgi:hypothetical protein
MAISIRTGRSLLSSGILTVTLACSFFSLHAQQTEVSRYDVYAGFADLYAPALGLNQTGFHTQGGLNMRSWYSLGYDYSVASGSEVLTPGLLPPALQAEVAGLEQEYIEEGLLPANYQLAIKTDAFTQTFAAGPQLMYRHFTKFTLFIRPSLGALRERATPHPSDPFATAIAQALAPGGSKLDWTGFYGVGGGIDYKVSSHFGIRVQMDAVYNHPFNDILENGRWTYRYSVGPSFHFGRNIIAKTTPTHASLAKSSPDAASIVSSSASPVSGMLSSSGSR